jgi:Recombinase/Recombinase zinc beta ribbon domain
LTTISDVALDKGTSKLNGVSQHFGWLIPDERTAPVIRRIFTRYAAGRLGAAAIARRLVDEHAPAPPRGWQPNIVLWVLSNEAYVGRVHWRDQTFPGLHEPLIDQDTFDRAQALLKERGEDLAMRAASRADFLLTGLVRCGRCCRAYVGMSAKGNGGTYHYYACSGRQKLGRKSCDGERLPREKLEAAILTRLTSIYRDGGLIRDAIKQAAASDDTDRTALTEQRASLAKEIARSERAIDRYQDAFEVSDLNPAHFNERLTVLKARLDALHDQDQALAHDLAADTPVTPDAAALHAVADQLDHVIEHGKPEQAKALLAIFIAELRVNSRSEILPTYRVGAPVVCAPNSSMDLIGVLSNHDLQGSLGRLTKKLTALRASGETRRQPVACRQRPRRAGWVLKAVVQALGDRAEPMQAKEIHAAVEALLGEPVRWGSVKNALASNVEGPSPRFVRLSRGRYRLTFTS